MPDSEILRCKGPPILNDAERLSLVESVKWVDEVLTGGWVGAGSLGTGSGVHGMAWQQRGRRVGTATQRRRASRRRPATAAACAAWGCCAGVPYDLTPEFLHELFTKHKVGAGSWALGECGVL